MLNIPEIITKEEEDMLFKNVSNNIKRIRLSKGMSQLEVALSIGQKSSGFYACMENYSNDKHFNLSHLFRLSRLFNVKIEEFFR